MKIKEQNIKQMIIKSTAVRCTNMSPFKHSDSYYNKCNYCI